MSMFFSQIVETFNNQTIEKDFEKIDNKYIDKTFRFNINEQDENSNCLLSKDNEKNFELLWDLKQDFWFEEWKKNNYKKCKEIEINEQDFTSFLKKLPKGDRKKYVDKRHLFEKAKSDIYNNVDLSDLIRELEEERQKELFIELLKQKLKEKYQDKSEYLKVIDSEFEYKRISEINKNFKIFDNTLDSTNVKQGKLGTCYFLAVISTLSNYGQLLFQLFPNEKINMEGFYEICLYYQGKWVKVLIDDYFVFEKNSEEFSFTQPINDYLYSCLLEKAYAKIRGNYVDINGGDP